MSLDPNISHGQCYGSSGSSLNDSFIPCGNAEVASQACCWHGDACLEGDVCAGQRDGRSVTYVAGCTDKNYTAAACKNKYLSNPWVPLAYCSTPSSQWVVCAPEGLSAAVTSVSCACPTQTMLQLSVLATGSKLTTMAVLPASLGGTISWASSYAPTAAATTTTSMDRTHSWGGGGGGGPGMGPMGPWGTSFVPATATEATRPEGASATESPSSSKSVVVGAAVGAVMGLLVVAVVFGVYLLRKKGKKTKNNNNTNNNSNNNYDYKNDYPLRPMSRQTNVSELATPDKETGPWSPLSVNSSPRLGPASSTHQVSPLNSPLAAPPNAFMAELPAEMPHR